MSHARNDQSQHVPVPMHPDLSSLSERDQEQLSRFLEICTVADQIFLQQTNQDLRTGSAVFDTSRGISNYPADLAKEELEAYLDQHPDERDQLLSPYTIIVRTDTGFDAIPYSQAFRDEHDRIADLLVEARGPYRNQRRFLVSTATAFVTNEYAESDGDWVRADDAPLELILGYHETYGDHLFGLKQMLQAVVGIVLPKETQDAQAFQAQVGAFDAELGRRYGYRASTSLTPMVVIDSIRHAGDALYTFVPLACNLPNDPDIQKRVGSKKVFMRNIMAAKLETMTRRIAELVLEPELVSAAGIDTVHPHVIGHESSHGISFKFTGEDFGPMGPGLEEGKADVFGALFLYFLAKHGVVPAELPAQAIIGHLADSLRQLRFDLEKAHSVGALIQYNWLESVGALEIKDGRFFFRPERFETAFQSLGDALYGLCKSKSQQAAAMFLRGWAILPPGMEEVFTRLEGIPVDIDPIFEG